MPVALFALPGVLASSAAFVVECVKPNRREWDAACGSAPEGRSRGDETPAMRIGLTYDLRSSYLAGGLSELETAEFDRDDTIDALERALKPLAREVVRIGSARELIERLAAGDRWDLVFNITEGLSGVGREAQVPAILDVYGIPYTFSDTLITALCLHKGLTKTVVQDAGVPTADAMVVATLADLAKCQLRFPLFAKPVAEGTGKGVTGASRIANPAELDAVCRKLLAEFRQPVLVEEYLPGREFTVGILGTGEDAQPLGTLEIILLEGAEKGAYSYENKERCEELVEYRLVQAANDPLVHAAERIALQAWRALGCRDAGRVDLRCNAAGEPHFLEINPLSGLHPEHSDLPILATKVGLRYDDLIRRIFESAVRRALAEPPSLARKWSQIRAAAKANPQ